LAIKDETSHIGVRSILLALSFRVKKVKKYVAYYLPVAARILFLIPGFSRKTDSAHFNNKKTGPETHLIPCQKLPV
jgi:hypothetical protein